MDSGEAREVAEQRVVELRAMTYTQLRDMPKEWREQTGTSGTVYQVVSDSFWDDSFFGVGGKDGNLRVVVYVDDGGAAAFRPLTIAFIIAPDGTYVDEGRP